MPSKKWCNIIIPPYPQVPHLVIQPTTDAEPADTEGQLYTHLLDKTAREERERQSKCLSFFPEKYFWGTTKTAAAPDNSETTVTSSLNSFLSLYTSQFTWGLFCPDGKVIFWDG